MKWFTTTNHRKVGKVQPMPNTNLPHEFKGFDDLIEVFRAGTHTDSKGRKSTFSEADLDEMVVNAETSPVPAVVGHPDSTAPAYGWAKLQRIGKSLFAKFTDLHPAFVAAVKAKSYPNRSVAVLPEEGKGWVMRHIGWLGGVAPAIDGLKPVQFSAGGATLLEFSSATFQKEPTMSDKTLTQAEVDAAIAKARTEEQAKAQAIADKAKADLAAQEAKFNAQGAELSELRVQRTQEKVKGLIDKLKAEGKVLPAEEAGLAEFMVHLEAQPQQFEFSKGEGKVKKSPAEWFAEFMAARPKAVKLKDGKGDANTDPGEGGVADPQAIANSARAYMAEQSAKGVTISLPDAITHVSNKAGA